MVRPDKVAEVADVSQRLSDAPATLLTHYRGLSVKEISQLRTALREANAEMRVVKNTLARRAAGEAGIDGLDDLLVGPTGLVFCHDDPVAPAKAIKAFSKDHPELEMRGGWFDGELLDAAAAIKLADLESREDLLTKLAGLMYGALANTARLLKAPLEQQARLVQALIDAGGNPDAKATEAAEPPQTAASADSHDEPEAETDGEAPVDAGDDATAETEADTDATAEASADDDKA